MEKVGKADARGRENDRDKNLIIMIFAMNYRMADVNWEDISKRKDFHNLYNTAIEKTEMWGYLETLDNQGTLRPIRILDMGGGTGALGVLLDREFGPFVEYVNVDTDKQALEKSPGRKVYGTYTDLPKLIGEEEFDYVFCLNLEDKTRISQSTIDSMRRNGQGDGIFGIDLVSMTINNAYKARQLNGYIVLLNAASMISYGGMFIRGGVMPKDALKGTKDELIKLGFQSGTDVQLDLTMDTSRMMARFDIESAGENLSSHQLEKVALTYAQNFRLTTFTKIRRNANKKRLRERISDASNRLSDFYSHLEVQERFWS